MAETIQPITGSQFIKHVAPLLGLTDMRIRRIVIDADFRDVVMVYVEKVGDERLLEVDPPHVEDIKIIFAEGEQ